MRNGPQACAVSPPEVTPPSAFAVHHHPPLFAWLFLQQRFSRPRMRRFVAVFVFVVVVVVAAMLFYGWSRVRLFFPGPHTASPTRRMDGTLRDFEVSPTKGVLTSLDMSLLLRQLQCGVCALYRHDLVWMDAKAGNILYSRAGSPDHSIRLFFGDPGSIVTSRNDLSSCPITFCNPFPCGTTPESDAVWGVIIVCLDLVARILFPLAIGGKGGERDLPRRESKEDQAAYVRRWRKLFFCACNIAPEGINRDLLRSTSRFLAAVVYVRDEQLGCDSFRTQPLSFALLESALKAAGW